MKWLDIAGVVLFIGAGIALAGCGAVLIAISIAMAGGF